MSPDGVAARPASVGSRARPPGRSPGKPSTPLDKPSGAAAAAAGAVRAPEKASLPAPGDLRSPPAPEKPPAEKSATAERPTSARKTATCRGLPVPVHADSSGAQSKTCCCQLSAASQSITCFDSLPRASEPSSCRMPKHIRSPLQNLEEACQLVRVRMHRPGAGKYCAQSKGDVARGRPAMAGSRRGVTRGVHWPRQHASAPAAAPCTAAQLRRQRNLWGMYSESDGGRACFCCSVSL